MHLPTRKIAFVVALFALGCHTPRKASGPGTVVGKPEAEVSALSRNTLWYRVEVQPDSLDVVLRLFAPPPRTRFFLPGEWAGQKDYAASIHITGAHGPDGPRPFSLWRDRGELEVDTAQLPWVELRYRVDLSSRSRFHPRMVDGAMLAYGITFLVTPAQQVLERTRSIPVEVIAPRGWTAVSTWPLVDTFPSRVDEGKTVHAYLAEDAAELREAFLVVGPQVRTARRYEGSELIEIAFGTEFEGDPEHFADFVTTITRRYGSRYGAPGPVHVFVSSGAATNDEITGMGRRNGFVVEVPTQEPLSESARLLVAHEALHLWNGHRLVPRPDVEASTRWFKEGVTHYLALKALAATGNVTPRFVLGELAKSAANYERNPISRRAPGTELDRARFPYDFGVLVALATDTALHQQSGGTRSAQDWLAALVREARASYDEQDLLVALQSLAGSREGVSPAELVWRRYVRVREPVDVSQLFAQIGLHWLPETPQRPARLVPLDSRPSLFRELFQIPFTTDATSP